MGQRESVTIDLGDVTADTDDGIFAPAPGQSSGRRSRRWRRMRPALAGALAVLCLAVLTAAAPSDDLGSPLWTLGNHRGGFYLGSDAVYLWPDSNDSGSPSGVVASARLDNGESRWSQAVEHIATGFVETSGGYAAIGSMDVAAGGPDDSVSRFVSLVGPTGEIVARWSGFVATTVDSQVLVIIEGVISTMACAGGWLICGPVEVVGVDGQTGRQLWRVPVGGAEQLIWPGRDVVAVRRATGEYATFDIRTGGKKSDTAPVGGAVEGDINGDGRVDDDAMVIGDRLILKRITDTSTTLVGYQLGTGSEAWTLTLTNSFDGSEPGPLTGSMMELGPYLFVGTNRGVAVIDPEQGVVIAGRSRLETVAHIGGSVYLTADAEPLHSSYRAIHRLWSIIDLKTGATLATVADAAQVSAPESGGEAILAREAQGWTEFVAVNVAGGLRSIGVVEGRNLSCQTRSRYLACADDKGTLRVWRLPRR